MVLFLVFAVSRISFFLSSLTRFKIFYLKYFTWWKAIYIYPKLIWADPIPLKIFCVDACTQNMKNWKSVLIIISYHADTVLYMFYIKSITEQCKISGGQSIAQNYKNNSQCNQKSLITSFQWG